MDSNLRRRFAVPDGNRLLFRCPDAEGDSSRVWNRSHTFYFGFIIYHWFQLLDFSRCRRESTGLKWSSGRYVTFPIRFLESANRRGSESCSSNLKR